MYFLFSFATLTPLYVFSRHFSGKKFRWKWFCTLLLLTLLLGSFHMSTIEYGYDLLFPTLKPILQGNALVGWIAFISTLLHTCCVPTQYEPWQWFSRKKN
jgi:hypothetical protein